MNIKPLFRRHLLTLTSLLSLSSVLGNASATDEYPSKPVKVIVGYTAGGAVDAIARLVGQQMTASLGQPMIVENKPGAGTNVAVKELIASPPDGYTLMLTVNALAVNPTLF